ncbi:MAG: arsenate reductase (glutaredoxin) [Bacteroidota bacterium]|nr:arsenate reductase (glutaredoxin) [Bacteroidota bacterium]
MITIYHNPRCSKSRAGLAYLQEKIKDFEIREYLKDPLNYEEISDLVEKLNITPFNLVRTQEDVYKSEFKGKEFANEEWIQILTDNPKLIQRPIVVKEHSAVLAQPPENIDKLL